MIVTPHMQIAVPFQNAPIDVGKAGLSWSNPGGTAGYNTGQFGRAYQFASPTNYLWTAETTNPANISDEYTFAFWVYFLSSQANFISLGGVLSGTAAANVGLTIQVSGSAGVTPRIQQGTTSGYNSQTTGRWGSGVFTEENEWNFVVCRRNNDDAWVDVWNATNGWSSNAINFGGSVLNLWNSRRNYIGAVNNSATETSANVSVPNTDGRMQYIQVFNKVLPASDIIRLMHGMHPLNG
jgi:hypothetical protein